MNQFYLNDCLGVVHADCNILSEGLVSVIKAYKILLDKKKLRIREGWVLEKEASEMRLAGIPLCDVVNNMTDRESRRLFYCFNTKYPIHRYFTQFDADELLTASYTFEGEDAINIAIASKCNGCLLSLPVSESLQKDYLNIEPSDSAYGSLNILNLHGGTLENILSVERSILDRNYEVLSGLEKIKGLAPIVECTEQFERRFNGLTEDQRKYIFDRIDEARRNNILQPLRSNGTIIKRVDTYVAELRIVNPVDIRVYFYEKDDALYFAKLALKSEYVGKNDQAYDIANSKELILAMLKASQSKR